MLNTVFFMGFLVLIFYNCDYVQNLANTLGAANAFMFIVLLVGVQAIFRVGHLLRRCRCGFAAGTEIFEDELKIYNKTVDPGTGRTLHRFLFVESKGRTYAARCVHSGRISRLRESCGTGMPGPYGVRAMITPPRKCPLR